MDFLENENQNELEKTLVKYVKNAVDFRSAQRDKEYITNRAHYEGLQWNLAENKSDSPFLLRSDINHLKNAVDLRLGSLCSDKYWGELMPLSPNDVDSLNDLNVLYKNEWNRLNADDIVEFVVKNGAICDNGYAFINFDPSIIIGGTQTRREGAITLEGIDTNTVYLDPTADKLENCEYMVHKIAKSKKWIQANKPDWIPKLEKLNIKPGNSNSSEDGDIFAGRDYTKSHEGLYNIDVIYVKESEEVKDKTIDETTGEEVVENITRTRVREHFLIGDKYIETNDKYPFDEFPIIGFQWESMPQSPYGIPLLRGLTTPQKVANLIESAANNIAMHYTVPTWLVSEESGIDIDSFAKLSNALGMAWKVTGDVSRAVKQMDPPQINSDLIGIKDSFVYNIRSYAGVNDVYIGSVGTAGSTAEGTNTAVNRATIIDNAPIKQIEKFVEKLSRMIVKFMIRYYKDQKVYIRETDKDATKAKFKEVDVTDKLSNINFEFYVDLASRSKSDKNRQYNLMKDLYTIQNQYKESKKVINVPDLIKAARLDNYNEMYKRFSDMSDEAFQEKANLIVQLMEVGQTQTPNGQFLITGEELQQGIIDILDDNGDLTLVENIFKSYEEYQTQVTNLKNQMFRNRQKAEIDELNNAQQSQQDLINQLVTGRENIMNQANQE